MQIAYHGIPDKAYEVFLEANQAEGKKVDSLKSKNPAGNLHYTLPPRCV